MGGAGAGLLIAGVAVAGGWVAWLSRGRPLMRSFADDLVARAHAMPRQWRWVYGRWSSARMLAGDERRRAGFGMWLALTLALPIFAVVLIAAGIDDLAR